MSLSFPMVYPQILCKTHKIRGLGCFLTGHPTHLNRAFFHQFDTYTRHKWALAVYPELIQGVIHRFCAQLRITLLFTPSFVIKIERNPAHASQQMPLTPPDILVHPPWQTAWQFLPQRSDQGFPNNLFSTWLLRCE